MPLRAILAASTLLPAPGAGQPSWWSCQAVGEAFSGEYQIKQEGLTLSFLPDKKGELKAFISNNTLVDIAFWGKDSRQRLKLEGDTHFWRDHVFLDLKHQEGQWRGFLKGVERDGQTPWKTALTCSRLEANPADKRSPETTFADCQQAWGEVLVLLQNIHSFRGQHPATLAGILDHKLSHNHLKVWATQSCQDWTVRLKMKGRDPLYYISASPRGMPICRLVADAERKEVGPVGDCPKIVEVDPQSGHGGHH